MNKIIITMIRKEIQLLIRTRTVVILMCSISILLLFSVGLAALNYKNASETSKAANKLFRKQWEQQHGNPHTAAHFGTYLFKPVNFLNVLDPGLNDYYGTTYRVEAHTQHEVEAGKALSNDASSRLGTLSVGLVMQLMIPILILFMACSSLTSEREAGTLKIQLAQGVKPRTILWTKIWANYLLVLVMLLPLFILTAAGSFLTANNGMELLRLLVVVLTYLLFYLLLVLIAIMISAVSSSSKNALFTVLCVWLFAGVIFPKLATGFADRNYPLMSRATFSDYVRQGYLKGLNGKDPAYIRGERYFSQLLKKYGAETASQLPVDASAIIMQLNEDYQNRVFDHYYNQISNTFQKQQSLLSYATLINPFMAVRRLSMTFSGTDYNHHTRFFNQARSYRNSFIRTLNMELAAHPVKDGEHYEAGKAFFKSIPDFQFRSPGILEVLELQWVEIITLFSWSLLLILIVPFIAKHFIL